MLYIDYLAESFKRRLRTLRGEQNKAINIRCGEANLMHLRRLRAICLCSRIIDTNKYPCFIIYYLGNVVLLWLILSFRFCYCTIWCLWWCLNSVNKARLCSIMVGLMCKTSMAFKPGGYKYGSNWEWLPNILFFFWKKRCCTFSCWCVYFAGGHKPWHPSFKVSISQLASMDCKTINSDGKLVIFAMAAKAGLDNYEHVHHKLVV